jgi:Arc/MetJ-type ribon-helix-helix transcriptional regulator
LKEVVFMKAVRVKLPEELLTRLDELVDAGWFPSRDYVLTRALRKFLDSNRPETLEKFVLEDVEQALGGKRAVKGTGGL